MSRIATLLVIPIVAFALSGCYSATQVSFLNQLATFVTLNLYSPMSVTVTCAAEGSMSSLMPAPDFTVPEEADDATAHDVFRAAAQQSAQAAAPVRVKVD